MAANGFTLTWLDGTGTPLSPNEAPRSAGDWQVRAVVNDNIHIGKATRAFTITPAQLTVTARSYTITQGAALPTPQFDISGFVAGDTAANAFSTQPVVRLNVTDSNTTGTTAIDLTRKLF